MKNRNGYKWEYRAFDYLSDVVKVINNKVIDKYKVVRSNIDECDYFIVNKNITIPVEVKTIKYFRKGGHNGGKDYGRVKIILENHKYLLEHNGLYFFIVRNGKIVKLLVSAKTVDDMISFNEGYEFRRYAGLSARKLLMYFTNLDTYEVISKVL